AHAAAAKLAFNRAAELFKKAVELRAADDASLRDLYQHMGDALANAGRGGQAAEAYSQAADRSTAEEATRLQTLAAQQYLRAGRIEQGLPLMMDLLRGVGISYPTSTAGAITKILSERALISIARPISPASATKPMSQRTARRLDTLNAVFKEVFA